MLFYQSENIIGLMGLAEKCFGQTYFRASVVDPNYCLIRMYAKFSTKIMFGVGTRYA